MLPILIWPNRHLNCPSERVEEFDPNLQNFITQMHETMTAHGGIGLAAPQVGVFKRILIIDLSPIIPSEKLRVFINPRITEIDTDHMYKWDEGCLSVPGYFEERERPMSVTVEYQDVLGARHRTILHDLAAFAFQHELDHLNGEVFVDRLSELKKNRVKAKILKTLRARARVAK